MAKRATRRVVVSSATTVQSATAAPPATPAAKATKPQSDLIDALAFVSVIAKQGGTELETNVAIAHKWVVTFNGLVACGYPIADELLARPHTLKFLSAVKRAGNSLAISHMGNDLHLHAGKFKAIVPCLDFSTWPNVMPDAPIAPIDDTIKQALASVGVLATEGGQTVIEASVLLRDKTCIGTNRHVIMEYYHGHSLPPVAVPKIAANYICKVSLPLVSIGFGVNYSSATFHYANGSWIKTQLYNEAWPDMDRIFAAGEHYSAPLMDVPPDFWEGIEALSQFTKDAEAIFFNHNQLASHSTNGVGATYDVPGLTSNEYACNPKYLGLIEPFAEKLAFNKNSLRFQNANMRGLVSLKTAI